MDNRRDFLKKAAFLAGATGFTGLVPESIQKAMAIEPALGSTYLDAEHIVILMQENRSFDHCFGTLKGVRGFNDPRAIDLPNKNKVWLQSNAAGETYAPFRLDIKNTKATWMHSLPHSWQNQVDARNDGKYDQWLNVKRNSNPEYAHMPLTLGYHTREDLSFYYALADAFTVCDQNFCSSLTGTNPNRLYFWTGTIRQEQHENSKAHVWNEDMDYGTLSWGTFPERLEEHGISWKCYQNEVAIDTGFKGEEDAWLSNFQDNPLEFFAQYHIHLHEPHVLHRQQQAGELKTKVEELQKQLDALPAGDTRAAGLNYQLKKAQNSLAAIRTEQEKLQAGGFEKLSEKQKNLHQKAFDTNKNNPEYRELIDLTYHDGDAERTLKVPKGDILHQFRADVDAGKLPMVSWISAPENFSDHPTAAWYGAWYVSEVIDILTKNPEVWKKTIFILAYDENDGYFDHVPPFVAPHPHKGGTGKVSQGIDTSVEFVTVEQEQARKGFPQKYDRESPIGLGYRVPLVIASPWSKGGWVNSEVFDHTSTLQFLEKFLGKKTGKYIRETNISDWRRTFCGDLSSVFRPYHGEAVSSPQPLAKNNFVEGIHKAKFKKLPDNYRLLNAADIALFNQTPQQSPYMPVQEAGIKPSCALPYQIYVDGKLSADRKSFEIVFHNSTELFGKETAGTPFNVYAPGNYVQQADGRFAPVRTWAYGVKPGDIISDEWPLHEFENNHYHLRVYGPNGFYREFKGDAVEPAVAVRCDYQRNRLNKKVFTGNIELSVDNLSNRAQTIKITDHAYHAGDIEHVLPGLVKGNTLTIDLQKSHGWYDFSIWITGSNHFERRYAGRVETGKTSYSDPYMGRMNA
ncbi:phospholipase C, phosphocholine-specific [Mucilaginibacter sp. PPCGB 2223]|uniref:phosphocholine-specific phospholipase C n=1 Tax=Mucilaginibacter sp. PPCGB 2223 TaxID=1886027 RepID=UPI000826E6C3|nr:phospholipase C, phosphocholine-specific [Mucilaginibacter sp. PPCGB 2223]OCX51946.1 phospholipase C, phosphocholine-specific [Mucilaginibacter sp. PPCGB 2223]